MVINANLNRRCIKGLAVTTLSFSSWMMGLAPGMDIATMTVTFQGNTIALAQSNSQFTPTEITNYARAAIALEARRYQVVNEIKKIAGEVPRIVCDQPSSIKALPGNIPQIAVNYCDQARKIIERRNLTVARFNQITRQQSRGTSAGRLR